MKKTVSILLIVAMLLASLIAIIPASAVKPDGVAITNEAEFLAMTFDGAYYLANDITLSTSYNEFKGTLDGNGKTITVVSAISVFKRLTGATVKNLNVVSDFDTDYLNGNYGALAGTVSGGTYSNINADVNMKFTKPVINNIGAIFGEAKGNTTINSCTSRGYINIPANDQPIERGVGGIVGIINDGNTSINGCENYLDIESFIVRGSNGGIVGMLHTATANIENCINYGMITTISGGLENPGNLHCGSGGIIGQFQSPRQGTKQLTIKNCRNYASITAKKLRDKNGHDSMIGGILGRVYGSKTVSIENCVNSGKINHEATSSWSSSGGILGNVLCYNYSWSTVVDPKIDITNCVNIGTVNGGVYAGGIAGSALQMNSKDCCMTIYDCANYADVNANIYAGGIIGASGNGGAINFKAQNCYNSGDITANNYTGGIFGWLQSKFDDVTYTADAAYAPADKIPETNIISCVNEGNAKMGIFGFKSGSIVNIRDCVNTLSNIDLCPNDTSIYKITAPQNANAVKNDVLKIVPGNPAELDNIIAEYADFTEDDFISGGSDFIDLCIEAKCAANVAKPQSDIDYYVAALNEILEDLSLKPIDLSDLNVAITRANAYANKKEQYTPITWNIFSNAFAAANQAKTATRMSVVTKATNNLLDAIANLEERPDLSTLKATINAMQRLDVNTYTSSTFQVLTDAITKALELIDNENATASQVDNMINQLNAAKLALCEKASTDELDAYIENIIAEYHQSKYTNKSYNKLLFALNKAKDASTANDMSAEDISIHIDTINTAIDELELRATFEKLDVAVEELGYGDIIQSNSLLETMRRDHTPAYWDEFVAVITRIRNAKDPNYAPNISEANEEDMIKALKEAYAQLTRYARYTEMDKKLFEVSQFNEADYTPESWREVAAAVYACEQLKYNRNTTQPEADAALDKLNRAVEGLVVADIGDIIDNIDVDELLQMVLDAKNKYSPEEYTEESYKLFNEVVNSINGAISRGDLTEEDIQDYAKRLENAIDSLEKEIVKSELESIANEYTDEIDLETLGCSGSLGISSLAVGAVMALAATVLFQKRKEN